MWTKINWNDNTTIPRLNVEIKRGYVLPDGKPYTHEGISYYRGFKVFEGMYGEKDREDCNLDIWWCYAPVFEGEE